MPSVYFHVRWPDQSESQCYSPSTVIHDYFRAGEQLSLQEFLIRARDGLGAASERVRMKFGFACSSAADQLAQIEAAATRFAADATVEVLAVD